MTNEDKTALDALRNDRSKLSLADAARAVSLIAQHDRWTLSPAQWRLVHVLAKLAAGAAAGGALARVRTPIGDLSRIVALFARAGDKLAKPAIVLGDGTGREYRLKVARGRARHPGTLDVTASDDSAWFGRILLDGDFEASPLIETPPMLPVALRAFALDPAAVAGAHARATGRCMFCNHPIGEGDDPRARSVGYGEVCARNWSQPFPAKSAAIAAGAAGLASASTP